MTERIIVDRLYIDKNDISDFKRLRMKDSPFYQAKNKDLFIAAMVIGFKEECRLPLKKKEGFIMKAYLTSEDIALINSIAIAEEGTLDVLLDQKKVFSIVEEYATGGISILKELVFSEDDFGSYSKKLESEILRKYDKIRISEPEEEKQDIDELFSLSAEELTKYNENEYVEYKSSMFYNYDTKQKHKLMGEIIVKTISSFMNTKGGVVLVGVSDSKEVLGIEEDLKTLKDGNLDKYEVNFTSLVVKYLGKIPRKYVQIVFEKLNGKDVALLKVKKSPRPVYVEYKGQKEFYVRQGNCCQPLDVEEAHIHIKDNWPDI